MLTRFGVKSYSRKSTRVTAAIAEAADAALLRVAIGRPLLVVESVDVDGDGVPVLTSRSRFAADRLGAGDRDVSSQLSAKTSDKWVAPSFRRHDRFARRDGLQEVRISPSW